MTQPLTSRPRGGVDDRAARPAVGQRLRAQTGSAGSNPAAVATSSAGRPLLILSLGAGVQSTTVALMSAVGELPKLDHAIFADTGWEPAAVYRHLDWLEPELARAGIPVRRVSAGNIRENFLNGRGLVGKEHLKANLRAPVYIRKPDGTLGSLFRTCTDKFKIGPLDAELKRLAGDKLVEQWFGISLDETQRMRVSQRKGVTYAYPLIDCRMTRDDCLLWMERRAYPRPPRSACIGCPYRSDHEWRHLRDENPEGFADAIAVDEAMRQAEEHRSLLKGRPYLYRKGIPLAEADLSTPEDHGQLNWLTGIAAGECSGMCGV